LKALCKLVETIGVVLTHTVNLLDIDILFLSQLRKLI